MDSSHTIKIRAANPDDSLLIATLHAKSWQENYRTAISKEYLRDTVFNERKQIWLTRLNHPKINQLVLIAQINNEFCGFICLYGNNHPKFGTLIDNLHVKPEAKGLGVGSSLLSAASKWALAHYQTQGLYLEVLACNPKAIAFYESKGAQNIGSGFWLTPCNNKTKEYIYRWNSPADLINNAVY
ncbi:hypothetical protein PSECIP111951_03947 [Pseudoalteromonas holothuriae]|uniref:N-acetyltransferase domain-containing protein n=1 Tax=Pseudoalteromonas holothuriae TaxID=2963714 RepID=A0A9W4QS23_9GAMM|nr:MULTISPECIES: GNAT family N-acetyltransferase [unclassified Pseudoalteromonas]CAH9050256.1 hypothetical protein PSECIP111854_00492 [Pseudoalteromonas sp. CIP111854]CAH9067943.1 hypothetical protein PSECIP111951_03947 [Pseudoalteromonas sp. CIP111951]